ncbi:MAG: coproporphyrinogen III oxidase family protein, partial [bacterium]
LPDEDQLADLYEAATDLLLGEGYEQYELSNWARPGHESRHNRTYWTDGEYLGIGAGAHGYLAGERYENLAHPSEYIERLSGPVLEASGAVASRYSPDPATSMSDWLGLRLRLIEGFLPEAFESRFGKTVFECVGPVLEDCASAGVLEVGPRIRLTRRGRLLHGEVAARLLAHINRSQSNTSGVS